MRIARVAGIGLVGTLLLALVGVFAVSAAAGDKDVLRNYKSRYGRDSFLSEKEEVLDQLVATADPKALKALEWCYQSSVKAVEDKSKDVEKLERKLAPLMEEYQEKFKKFSDDAVEKGKPPPKQHPPWPVALKAQKLQADVGYAVKQMEEQRTLVDLARDAYGKLLAVLPEDVQMSIQSEWVSGPLGDKDWKVRGDHYRLMSGTPTDWALGMLIEIAESEPDPRALVMALDGLGGKDAARVLPVLGKRLEDVRWTVRVAALRAVEKTATKECVDLILATLAREDGRLMDDCGRALRALTGEDFGTNAIQWKNWWDAQREEWKGPPPPVEEPDEDEKPDPDAFMKEPEDENKGRTGFFGIDTRSKRLVYVIDISGSMNEKVGAKGDKDRPTRAELAKKELKTAVTALEDGALFNIVFFAGEVRLWKKEMTLSTAETRTEALGFIDKAPVVGGTATYDALEQAFDLGDVGRGRKRGADPEGDSKVDTIILLSDGRPSVGRTINPGAIRAAVREWNRARRIAVHTVAFGKDADHKFMKGLAGDAGGTYVAK